MGNAGAVVPDAGGGRRVPLHRLGRHRRRRASIFGRPAGPPAVHGGRRHGAQPLRARTRHPAPRQDRPRMGQRRQAQVRRPFLVPRLILYFLDCR